MNASRSRIPLIVGAIVVVVVLAAAWYFLSPLFIDTVANDPFPLSADASIPPDMSQEEVESEMAAVASAPPVEADEPMTDEMAAGTVLATGEFAGVDSFHQASGSATIYDLGDGSRILRFEDFEVTNGPDLHVFLTPAGGVMEGALDLGSLRGNVGNQNYELPADADLTNLTEAVIYCVPFSVTFATALLEPPA